MTNDTPDLLLCPFCDGKPYTRTTQGEDLCTNNIVNWYYVGCHNCDLSFGIPDGYDCGTAFEQWNTRAGIQPLTRERIMSDPLVKNLVEILKRATDDLEKGWLAIEGVEEKYNTDGSWHVVQDARAVLKTISDEI